MTKEYEYSVNLFQIKFGIISMLRNRQMCSYIHIFYRRWLVSANHSKKMGKLVDILFSEFGRLCEKGVNACTSTTPTSRLRCINGYLKPG